MRHLLGSSGTHRRTLLLALAFVATMTASAQAEDRQVYLTGNKFTPAVRVAAPGDTVTLSWLDGTHDVVAYMGADFRSGPEPAPFDLRFSYSGGVVRYRCVIHSSLADGFGCKGMCGATADRALDDLRPEGSITEPKQYDVVVPQPSVSPAGVYNPVTISGTAIDNVAIYGVMVRIYDTTGKAKEYAATCAGCPGPSVTWTTTRSLMPGSYVAELLVADTSGNTPAVLPRAHFFVA